MHMKALLYVVWLNKLWDFHTKESLLAPPKMKQFYVYKDIRISKLLISEEKTWCIMVYVTCLYAYKSIEYLWKNRSYFWGKKLDGWSTRVGGRFNFFPVLSVVPCGFILFAKLSVKKLLVPGLHVLWVVKWGLRIQELNATF